MLDGNLKCVDLSDLTGDLPLDIDRSDQILWRSEEWEYSTWDEEDGDSVGYPTLVKNDRGPDPNGLFYMYYSHHDPNSGIGCAIAETIEGPYRKLADGESDRGDSRVLVNPGKPGQPFHYASPCVVWSEEEKLWFLYFHLFENQWETGGGHQRTVLATCPDLKENIWTPWTDDRDALIPVFPTTTERWMNSQSSYHAVQRLPDGRWLGFLRGTGGEYSADGKWLQDTCKLGFAMSGDGRTWDYFPDNPILHQEDGGSGSLGVYRPHFVGWLSNDEYLLCWSESRQYDDEIRVMYGRTKDFRTIVRDPRGYARWPIGDGLISPWREGNRLYLFAGKFLHQMVLA